MQGAIDWLNRNKDLGVLFFRLFIGIRLVYGVLDNVFVWNHMILFSDFLKQSGFPLPLASAIVSVYAQLIAGLMILVGWKIRIAALLMIINFLIAVLMVHLGQSFEQMTPALAMLFSNVLFLFYGAGKYAFDKTPAHDNIK
ncbi:MAG: DoxX family protein [Chitinophagaceae bacterium]